MRLSFKKRHVVLLILLLLVVAVKAATSGVTVNAPFSQFLYQYIGKDPTSEVGVGRLQLPKGFQADVWATDIPGVRMLEQLPTGELLASQPRQGKVVVIAADRSGQSMPAQVVLEGLDRPHGLAVHGEWLYIAEGTAVLRTRWSRSESGQVRAVGDVERIITGLPDGGNHWTRSLGFGPDGRLYISVGSSCNVCIEKDARRAAMLVANADGTGLHVFATGLRNSVGFDWHPQTSELFATDNGRDLLGDDFPPCELNKVVEHGFYGWPYANGNRIPDPDLGSGQEEQIANSLPPAFAFGAHTAPLGLSFLRHNPELQGDSTAVALAALHGSWNRSKKSGYKVVLLRWGDDGVITSEDFFTGFEKKEHVMGRPVDVLETESGDIFITDDFSGVIWRVHTDHPKASKPSAPQPSAIAHSDAAETGQKVAAADLSLGERLYQQHACTSCHGTYTDADKSALKPLMGLTQRYTQASLSQFFTAPTPPMPFIDFSEEERQSLARFLLNRTGG